MKSILFFGDSNTWGFNPETGGRYDYADRWTTVCAERLGSEYNCIPCGMNGRTTVFDDPCKGCRNGLEAVDFELQTHKPLNLAVIMLGTNDLKYTDAGGSAEGLEKVALQFLTANERFPGSYPAFPDGPEILLASPVLIKAGPACRDIPREAEIESEKLSGLYAKVAEKHGLHFMDAKDFANPSVTDGVHLDIDGHRRLGIAFAEKIRRIS